MLCGAITNVAVVGDMDESCAADLIVASGASSRTAMCVDPP